MALPHDDFVRQRLADLLRDVRRLSTVSGLGFVDPDKERVQRALAKVAADTQAWRFEDLRGKAAEAAAQALFAARLSPVLVLALDVAADFPRPVENLLRAKLDNLPEVELHGALRYATPPDQSVLVLCVGAASLQEVPSFLERVPYWDFLPR